MFHSFLFFNSGGTSTSAGSLAFRSIAGSGWVSSPNVASNAITSAPAAISWGTNRIDVIARGLSGEMRHWATVDGGANFVGDTIPSVPVGSVLGKPAIASNAVNRLDVVWVDATTHNCMQTTWTGTTWVPAVNLGGVIHGVSALWHNGIFEIFALGSDDSSLWHRVWNGSWGVWEQVNIFLNSAAFPPAVSTGSDPADVEIFVSGVNTPPALWHGTLHNGVGNTPESLGGVAASGPSAIAGGTRVAIRGSDGQIWEKIWSPPPSPPPN